MRYFVFISDQKSCYFCACNNSKPDFIPQPQKQKNCRRQTQCSSTLCGYCAPGLSGVVLCNPFKWDILCSFLIKNLVIFVRATTANWISFHNHRNRKVVGGKRNVLLHYVDVSAPDPSGVVLCNPFKWDIVCPFLIKNHLVVFVPSATV